MKFSECAHLGLKYVLHPNHFCSIFNNILFQKACIALQTNFSTLTSFTIQFNTLWKLHCGSRSNSVSSSSRLVIFLMKKVGFKKNLSTLLFQNTSSLYGFYQTIHFLIQESCLCFPYSQMIIFYCNTYNEDWPVKFHTHTRGFIGQYINLYKQFLYDIQLPAGSSIDGHAKKKMNIFS
jgi:hypothetical protein